MAMDNSERIDKFLRGLMTPEENEAFMNDFNKDEELRKEAQITALMIKALEERQKLEDTEIIDEVAKSKKKAKIIKMIKWVGSIAAMFIILWGANIEYNNHKDEIFFSQNYTPYKSISPVRTGIDKSVEKELSGLFNRINTDDVVPIIDRLQTIYDNILSDNDDYAQYNYFESTIARYLALAYVKGHNRDKAKKILLPWVEKGDKKAVKLFERLENI